MNSAQGLVGRRTVLGQALLIGGVAATADTLLGQAAAAQDPIVEVTEGRLRGQRIGDIAVFKGIHYGASTAGVNRFLPPKPPAKWAGIRDALQVGPTCPQMLLPIPNSDPAGTPVNEDCLVLNVWTPQPERSQKRPVMVWLHGGGYSTGSGSWAWYDGANLARKGEVVVVTLNHRLNVFGYLYLGDLHEKYAESGNVGMLDIVRALEWIRDNIQAFGGDPANVTLFGESGGAMKVGTLMGMPSAKGLFHKAIQQSGPALRGVPRERAAKSAQRVLDSLQLRPDQADELQNLPAEKLLDAIKAIPMGGATSFAPVVAGTALPRDPFSPDAPAMAAGIPLLIGTNRDEATTLLSLTGSALDPAKVDDAVVRQRLQALGAGAVADALVADYRQRRPGASPYEILIAIGSDLMMRIGSITEAERKVAQAAAPVYMYLFTWESPRPGLKAGHAVEITFVFDNLAAAEFMTGTAPERAPLADQMARSWAAFARTGNPNAAGLPQWPAYDTAARATMEFNLVSKVVHDPGREDRLTLVGAGLADRPLGG